MLPVPNVCHGFFRVGTMRESCLRKMLIYYSLKKHFEYRGEGGEVFLRGRKDKDKGRGENAYQKTISRRRKSKEKREEARNKPKTFCEKINGVLRNVFSVK